MANTLIRSILPRAVTIGSAKIAINPNDPVISGALALRIYEREEIRFFQKYYEPGMNFLDVGANIGLYTGLALAMGKNCGRILSIEPHAESRHFLAETIRLNTQRIKSTSFVAVAPVAVGAAPKQLLLYSNTENKGDNRIYADHPLTTSTNIEMVTIDALCSMYDIPTAEFVKIDIQGAEFQALQGAASLLSRSQDCILMTEFWSYGLKQAGSDPESYIEFIKSFGFAIYELKKNRLMPLKDYRPLLKATAGRAYRNLIALKGRHHIRIRQQ